jgi:hypothetical protein
MITREQAVEMLTDYFEQRLAPDLRHQVETHIAANALTKHVLETYKKTVVLCRESQKHRVAPADFASRLLSFLRERTALDKSQGKGA